MDESLNINEDSNPLTGSKSLEEKILPRMNEAVIDSPSISEMNTTVWATTSVFDKQGPVCEPLKQSYLLVVSVAPALVVIENLIFFAAVFLYRRKLKHNNVYMYVTSALFANILTSLWAFYHFLNYYYGLESWEPTHWWAFRKGRLVFRTVSLESSLELIPEVTRLHVFPVRLLFLPRFWNSPIFNTHSVANDNHSGTCQQFKCMFDPEL